MTNDEQYTKEELGEIHPWTNQPKPDNQAIADAAHQADLAAQAALAAAQAEQAAYLLSAEAFHANQEREAAQAAYDKRIATQSAQGFQFTSSDPRYTGAHDIAPSVLHGDATRMIPLGADAIAYYQDHDVAVRPMTRQEQSDYNKANCFGSGCRKYKGTPVTASEWDRKHPETTARGLMFPMAPAPKLVKHGTQNFWQTRGQAQKAPSEVPFLNPYSAEELHNIMPARKYDQYGQIVGNPEIKKAQKIATPEYKARLQKTKQGFVARKKYKRKKDEKKKGFGFDVPW